MKAGKPKETNGYIEKDVDGIKFYIAKGMADTPFTIGWFGIWIFGYYNITEG